MVLTQIVYGKPPDVRTGMDLFFDLAGERCRTPRPLKTYKAEAGSILGCVLRPKSSSR